MILSDLPHAVQRHHAPPCILEVDLAARRRLARGAHAALRIAEAAHRALRAVLRRYGLDFFAVFVLMSLDATVGGQLRPEVPSPHGNAKDILRSGMAAGVGNGLCHCLGCAMLLAAAIQAYCARCEDLRSLELPVGLLRQPVAICYRRDANAKQCQALYLLEPPAPPDLRARAVPRAQLNRRPLCQAPQRLGAPGAVAEHG
mmetsp:Transcript_30524/g.97410  ORF Transcript_30524/g.97410 Transcript_30524/m.97410 type:complete len:201 (-) Transcript_30524:65-667(-)